MKKIIVLMVAVLMVSFGAKAQSGYDNTKHEIGVTYGILSNSQWIDALEEVVGLMVGATFSNEKFTGPIGIEYFYHAKNWLSVGGIFAYGKNTRDVASMSSALPEGKMTHTYLTIMPSVKLDWLRKEHFGMYSKLAVGATFRTQSTSGVQSDSDTKAHLNWQASLLGMEAGSPKVRGFAEFGMGEQGVIVFGIRYKF